MQVKPAELLPSAIFGEQAGALGAALQAPAGAGGSDLGGSGGVASTLPSADALPSSPKAFSFGMQTDPDAAQQPPSQQGVFPQTEQRQQPAHDFTFVLPQQPGQPLAGLAQQQDGPSQAIRAPAPPAAPAEQHAATGHAAVDDAPPAQRAVRLPSTAAAASAPPAQAFGSYDAGEMQRAQQIAARMRAECDVLK